MKKILIITGRYLPGYKDGGPVRTIKNLTDLLGDRYNFTIMCADRDHGDEKPYEGVVIGDEDRPDDVNPIGKANVFYVKDGIYNSSLIEKMSAINDLVYVCGPYNPYAIKTLILKKTGRIKCPVVLAPMGSFSKGALAIKGTKKKLFFIVMKLFGLFNGIPFSVTSEVEKAELKEMLKLKNKCFIARDPQRSCDEKISHKVYKKDNILQVVFLSRICEKKNLLGAIDILSNVRKSVSFSIYGNIEDKEYYERCLAKLNKLPKNITWEYKGLADSETVPEVLSQYDTFLFPTFGENFGHVISESLMAGTIPVISDTTPWLDFDEYKAGYVINIGDFAKFSETIEKLADMTGDEIKEISNNATEYYKRDYKKSVDENGYMEMFDELLR